MDKKTMEEIIRKLNAKDKQIKELQDRIKELELHLNLTVEEYEIIVKELQDEIERLKKCSKTLTYEPDHNSV